MGGGKWTLKGSKWPFTAKTTPFYSLFGQNYAILFTFGLFSTAALSITAYHTYDRTVKFNFGLGPFNLRVDLGFLDLIEPVFRGQKIKTSGAFRDIVFFCVLMTFWVLSGEQLGTHGLVGPLSRPCGTTLMR